MKLGSYGIAFAVHLEYRIRIRNESLISIIVAGVGADYCGESDFHCELRADDYATVEGVGAIADRTAAIGPDVGRARAGFEVILIPVGSGFCQRGDLL